MGGSAIAVVYLFAAAGWETWTRPVWPMLGGVAVAVGTAYGISRLWARRDELGKGVLLAGLNTLAVAVIGLGIWLVNSVNLLVDLRIVYASAVVVGTPFLLFGLVSAFFPKLAIIARTTTKEATAQPLFWVLLAVGLFALLALPYIPGYTLGEDVKMLKDSGLTLIKVLAIVLALWTASVAISDEIEGRTAVTVLSKPVSRRQFIIGKFLGLSGAVTLLFLVLGVVFLITVSYKVVYDARESGVADTVWPICWMEMVQIVPGLVLALFEAVLLTSISVAISTRLPMLPNLIICTSVYILGHLVPLLAKSEYGGNEIVRFVGTLFALALPVLEHFDIQAGVATGSMVPLDYLAWAFVYTVMYAGVALLLALILFEDRDLA